MDLPGIDESDFYDDLNTLGCDYVMNVTDEDAKYALERVAKALKKAGFTVQFENLPEDCAFVLKTGDEAELKNCQKGWFHSYFDTFKQLAGTITLDEFACSDDAVYPIQTAMDDRYNDGVYLDMGTGPKFYRFMSFVRKLQPNQEYFFENMCVLMH